MTWHSHWMYGFNSSVDALLAGRVTGCGAVQMLSPAVFERVQVAQSINLIMCQTAWCPWAYFTTCYISHPSAQRCHAFVNVSPWPQPELFIRPSCHASRVKNVELGCESLNSDGKGGGGGDKAKLSEAKKKKMHFQVRRCGVAMVTCITAPPKVENWLMSEWSFNAFV